MLLENKVAVIYGAGGGIGSAVAQAFAQEGATVFLTGHRLLSVKAAAEKIASNGGITMAAEVDALDEQAVDKHLNSVTENSGRVDIMFNAVGIPNGEALGVPFVELDLERFLRPIMGYTRSYFLTARLVAKRMIKQKSGVILNVTAIPGRTGTLLNGGYGPAMAAKEALTRDLSAGLAPHGIRVLGLRPHGIPETDMIKRLFEIKAKPAGQTWEQFQNYLANWSHARRVMTLQEVANMAAFLASDKASSMTGTTVNLTMGGVAD